MAGSSLPLPSQLGYRMPAEWEPHRATWLTWPRPDGISFPDKYETVPPVYAEFIRQLALVEEVEINIWDESLEEKATEILIHHSVPLDRVHFHRFQAYEPWCRDHGPTFIIRETPAGREKAIVDWDYNAWGGKYPPFDLDDLIPRHVADLRGIPLFNPGIVMEGGSIDVNGQGTLLTTEACLLNPNRNPLLSRTQIEEYLRSYLGVDQVLWLNEGILGDDTDGHIDDLTRFADSNTLVTVVEEDPADPNYPILQDNRRRLQSFRNRRGDPFRILELPMPQPVEHAGQRLPASYANFYIANEIVLVPTYRDPNDARAIGILQTAFPQRRVIGIDSTELIWGLGSFHCISQQEPA